MRAKRRPAVYSPPVPINRRLPARGGARAAPLAFGGFGGHSKKALILRSSFCELFYSNIVVRRSADTAGQAGSGTLVETPFLVAHHALRLWSWPPPGRMSRRAIARGRKSPARGPVTRRRTRKSDAALHPIHCVTVMAATWTDAPEDHREGRRSPARGPVARRRARKSDAALHPMHCVSGAAIPVRLALLGARYGLCEPLVSPFAPRKNETFAKKWGQAPRVGVILPVVRMGGGASPHFLERTKLSRSERRLISPRRFPTTPLNLPAWSAMRPRFWARRSRPGISWSRSRRSA